MPSRTAADPRAAQHNQPTPERFRSADAGAAVPETAPRTLARAAAAPRALRPADVLRLQRAIGNRAVGALLAGPVASRAAPAPGALQRTVFDPWTFKLYVSPSWLAGTFDDRAEKVRDVALGPGSVLKNELLENLEASTGETVTSVAEVRPAREMLKTLKDAGYDLYGPNAKAKHIRRLKAALRDAVENKGSMTVLPDEAGTPQTGADVLSLASLRPKPSLLPNHLVKAPDDLTGGYDIAKVCALIALVKAEPRSALNAKLDLQNNLGSDADYYEALHDHYYTTQNVQYDEPSTHPPLYAEWGYTMVFSGGSSFRNLPNVLRKPLVTGKKYIMGIFGHVVYVTMRKEMKPGVPMGSTELLADYFDYHSDPANYNVSHDRDVDYIYEK